MAPRKSHSIRWISSPVWLQLVPKPKVNLTRYHGVLAPNHRWRGELTPARRGKGLKVIDNTGARSPAGCHAARACPASVASALGMTWAQRLKRVFKIDIEVCGRCGGSVRVIACIEDQDTIDRILDSPAPERNRTPIFGRSWCHRPERHLGTWPLFAGRDSSPTALSPQGSQ